MTTDFALDWIERQVQVRAYNGGFEPGRGDDGLARLGDLRPLLVAASMLDDPIEITVLVRMLDMDARQLAQPLARAVTHGHLQQFRRNGDAYCRFSDYDVKRLAGASLKPAVRTALHRRAAEALARSAQARSQAGAAAIARHWEGAGDKALALRWWRTAGERAVVENAPAVGIAHLRRGLALCEGAERRISSSDELAILSQLGPLEAQLNGSGSDAVSAVYARCFEIAGELDLSATAAGFDVLWGLIAWVLVHGRVESGLDLAGKLLRSAEAGADTAQLVIAHRICGLASMLAGRLGDARAAFDAVIRHYDYGRHALQRFRYASDQAALALALRAWSEAIAGMSEASERSTVAALDHTERLQHPHTSAHVMCVLAARAQTLGLRTPAALMATAGRALARLHHFPYWEAWADIILGWHESARHPQRGAERVNRAIAAYRDTGAGQALPYAYLLSAELAIAAGDLRAGEADIEAGLEAATAHGVRMFDSALLHAKARILPAGRERRAVFDRASDVARQHGALLFLRQIDAALIKGS